MKPDPDYIRRVLDAFEGCPKAFPTLDDLREQDALIQADERLAFHLMLMRDRSLVVDANGDPDIGIQICGGCGGDDALVISIFPLRLTAAGHEFAQQLRDPVVYEKVKGVIGTSGLGVAMSVAGAIATQLATRALGLPSP